MVALIQYLLSQYCKKLYSCLRWWTFAYILIWYENFNSICWRPLKATLISADCILCHFLFLRNESLSICVSSIKVAGQLSLWFLWPQMTYCLQCTHAWHDWVLCWSHGVDRISSYVKEPNQITWQALLLFMNISVFQWKFLRGNNSMVYLPFAQPKHYSPIIVVCVFSKE